MFKTISNLLFGFTIILITATAKTATAQEYLTQYPKGLKNAYFGLSIGSINYPFSNAHLEPGFKANNVHIPHAAAKLILYGCPITKNLSARITYMRPTDWAKYKNINGDNQSHSVWMNVGGLTLNGNVNLSKKISLNAEAGLAIVTRHGFKINNVDVVKSATYSTGLFGAAVSYAINNKWVAEATGVYSPKNKKNKQPYTSFIGLGFRYKLTPLPTEKVIKNHSSGYHFPKHLLMIGYSTNATGYGVNNFLSNGAVPVFWGGDTEVKDGFTISYQKNIFRGRKIFSMDLATGVGLWNTNLLNEKFFTLSLNPFFRFTLLRSKLIDGYFEFSVAGPTFISKTTLDNEDTGKKFTFHDVLGIGAFIGSNKNWVANLRIAHYSNGNIFPTNGGVKIPLTFSTGYAF